MPLVRDDDVVRVDLTTPGEWVEVKRRLSKGDRTRITGATMGMQMRIQGREVEGEASVEALMEASTFRGLEVGIRAWSFEEPVTPENIRKLEPDDYDALTEAVNGLWEKPLTVDEGNA